MSARPIIGDFVPLGQTITGAYSALQCTAPVQASNVLTSNNTNVSAGDSVTISQGAVVLKYTFVTALSSAFTTGQVLIGTSADDSLTNLGYAVNNTSAQAGIKFSGRVANPFVTASSVSAHAVTFTAISGTNETTGATGNTVATTTTASTLTWANATLSGGIAGILEVTGPSGTGIPVTPASPAGTYVMFHVANSGSLSGGIPTTAKRWAVNFVGSGTTNTFGGNISVTGNQSFSDNGAPASAIAIACDGSTVADGFYSTT